jgi:hypothetical protein
MQISKGVSRKAQKSVLLKESYFLLSQSDLLVAAIQQIELVLVQ